MAADGRVGRADGAVLFTGALAYTLFAIWSSRREAPEIAGEYRELQTALVARGAGAHWRWAPDAALIAGGLGLLVLGARWLVEAATAMARAIGLSELLIGLTIVAAGTSLPEVATSIVAALRGQRDIAVGNVVGSNLFNLMAVLGLAALVSPEGIAVSAQALAVDLPVMVLVALACLPVVASGRRIDRGEGALLLLGYVGYLSYLLAAARAHP
jgi:cation:H+ antiporter